MKISLSGLIKNARDAMQPGWTDEVAAGFMLSQLANHLAQLKANPEQIDQFFALYVDVAECDPDAYKPPRPRPQPREGCRWCGV